ncbi:hypothetical protein Tco_1528548 [Tanacetum coccineum]
MGDHYGYIRSYAKAILESNDGSTVRVGVTVNPDDQTLFDRFYVCFSRLKEGWKLGCRRVIALDGCFLVYLAISSFPFLVHKAECSLKLVHSREKPVQGLARAVEEDDYLNHYSERRSRLKGQGFNPS